MRSYLSSLLGLLCAPALAHADAPLIYCAGEVCGGAGPTTFAYYVDSASFPMMEFAVGTNDLDTARYKNVLVPVGWSFAIEPTGLQRDCGMFTPEGEVTSAYCFVDTSGRVRWWTDDPAYAIESFTFGFDHPWPPENVGWKLVTRLEGPPPEYHTFVEDWGSPVGIGTGPVHGPTGAPSHVRLKAAEFVKAGDADIVVPGYSVPSFVPWNGDALPDLVVGEGGAGYPGMVRVYLNVGTADQPAFADYFYVQSDGADLVVPAAGCQGAYPRVVYWDADGRKDLLVGQADGTVKLFLNIGTDDAPTFDAGTLLQVGEPGEKVDISVYARAAPVAADWNQDGRKDLVVGSVDGLIYLYLNEGTDTEPDFRSTMMAELAGSALYVPYGRSCPVVHDLDDDGKLDLFCGNREGQIVFYHNAGTAAAPTFETYSLTWAGGQVIDLPGQPRTRPFVCDWTADGVLDVLIGTVDGKVRLYAGQFAPGDLNCDGKIDAFDIDPFVLALIDPAAYAAQYPGCDYLLADLTGDGKVDAFDIDPFVDLLTSG